MLPPNCRLGFGCFKKKKSKFLSFQKTQSCSAKWQLINDSLSPTPIPRPVEQREREVAKELKCRSRTAVVQPVQLEEVRVAEVHPLADHIHEVWDPRHDGGLRPVPEGRLAVVHDRCVIIGHVQRVGDLVVIGVKIVLFA